MREKKAVVMGVMLALVSSVVLADKEIYYQDKNITIYSDNTVVRTGETKPMVFSASKTWVEEDFFTQQAKYCEVDGVKMKKALSQLMQSKTTIKN